MKGLLKALVLLLFLGILNSSHSQVDSPEGIYYQAVARDNNGNLMATEALLIEISIRENSEIIYTENHNTSTDDFGLFELVIGEGNVVSTNLFSDISWNLGDYFLLVSIDFGSGFELLSETQLLSVPFSLYSTTALNVINDNFTDADDDPQNETIQNFSIAGDSLRISEAGQEFSIALSDIVEDNDWELQGDSTLINSDFNRKVGINTDNPTSTLSIGGSLSVGVSSPGAVFDPVLEATENETVILCNVQDGPIEVTLPDATSCSGRIYYIKKYAESTTDLAQFPVTIMPINGQTIDLQTNRVLDGLSFSEMTIVSDGNNWIIISRSQG